MKFGYFDDVAKEYVITSPKTPYPWINYLGTESFFSLISNTAGGYHFYKDARLRRITRYRYNNVPVDLGGRYFYINDNGTVWNPGWSPVKTELDFYQTRHGMGYTVINGKKNDLSAELTFFVPKGYNGEVQKVVLKNEGNAEKSFTLYSFLEWCLWNAEDDEHNFQRNYNTGDVEVEGSTLFHKTEYRERRDHFAFYTVNSDIDGYDCDRESFFGLYNGFDHPDVVFENASKNSRADGWSPIASHSLKITLAPGEEKALVFVLGYVENGTNKWNADGSMNKSKAYEMIQQMNTVEKADKALAELKEMWDELLSKYTVDTPDEKVNRMVNIWNQYQCMVTFNMSRSASYFESGIGRGMGFRDSNQDLLGFVHQVPERARERLIDLASTQFEDGGCYHQYQPLTKKGNDAVGGDFSDDPLWMILSTVAYIKETGDFGILDEQVPYDNNEALAKPMFDHLHRSFYRVVNNVGPHGLPLAMRADWNDCINLSCFSDTPGESFQTWTSPKYGEDKYSKVAESLFVATLFTYTAPKYIELCKFIGNDTEAANAQAELDKMVANIKANGWDGDWFLRAYDDFGKKMGSKECEEGKIFIEPQGFGIMSDIGSEEGWPAKILDAVDANLGCKYGLCLNAPAYSKYYIEYGEISTYPQGYKENGSVFCHNNAWMIAAAAYAGQGDRAFDWYSRIAPAFIEDISDTHRTEPYVYGQMIAGTGASRIGEGKNSWLTGTAAWNFVAISQYILGIQPEFNGLSINPSIPSAWDGFKASRKFRGDIFDIEIQNPDHVCKGVKSVEVDGNAIEGNILPVFNDGKNHKVVVVLG